jgi:hypothetical protein
MNKCRAAAVFPSRFLERIFSGAIPVCSLTVLSISSIYKKQKPAILLLGETAGSRLNAEYFKV